MKEYKIVSESSLSSYHRANKRITKLINQLANDGWDIVSVSFSLGYFGYYSHATLVRDVNSNDFV